MMRQKNELEKYMSEWDIEITDEDIEELDESV